jgi:ATP-dependent DNA helicase RecG
VLKYLTLTRVRVNLFLKTQGKEAHMSNIGFPESVAVEFKSDKRVLDDAEIIDTVVAFANTEGGALYVGVEDDGEITGLNKAHSDTDRLAGHG